MLYSGEWMIMCSPGLRPSQNKTFSRRWTNISKVLLDIPKDCELPNDILPLRTANPTPNPTMDQTSLLRVDLD